jgi:ADP-ribose pyrophosphatase YjhB (NUDIX family)
MKHNKHIGVYGVCLKDKKILFIKKSRGPYKGLYDLPGGGIEFDEDVNDALQREFVEEVGTQILSNEFLQACAHTSLWDDDGLQTKTLHVGLYYEVALASHSIKTEEDGHDSLGTAWLEVSEITENNISPIAHKALQTYLQQNVQA